MEKQKVESEDIKKVEKLNELLKGKFSKMNIGEQIKSTLLDLEELEHTIKERPTPWEDKIKKGLFRGMTTGGRNLTQKNSVWVDGEANEH